MFVERFLEENSNDTTCDKCGNRLIKNAQQQLVCSGCGLVYDEFIDNFDYGAIRSKKLGNSEFIQSSAPVNYGTGTSFYSRECSSANKTTFTRIKKKQDRENVKQNSKKIKKQRKTKEILESAELSFRNIKIPLKMKPDMINLFSKMADELGFPANKAILYASAFAWWYVDFHMKTSLTIHSIARNLVKNNLVTLKPAKIYGNKRSLYDKIVQTAKLYEKNLDINSLVNKLTKNFFDDEDKAYLQKITGTEEERQVFIRGYLIKKIVKKIVDNPTYRDVEGVEYLLAITSDKIDKDKILLNLNICINIIASYKRTGNNVISRLSTYCQQITKTEVCRNFLTGKILNLSEEVRSQIFRSVKNNGDTLEEVLSNIKYNELKAILNKYANNESTVIKHIGKNMATISRLKMLTEKQINIMEATSVKLSESIKNTAISGMSRHTISVMLIWASLLYHGKRIDFIDLLSKVNLSKSTLGLRTRELEKTLGFKRSASIGKFGYLVPTRRNSVLCSLGESVKFNETRNSVMEACINELETMANLGNTHSFIASRFAVIDLLIKNKAGMERNKISEVIKKISLGTIEKKLVWYSTMHGGKTLDKFTSLIECNKDVFYISSRFNEYLPEVMSNLNPFIQLCKEHKFNRESCVNAVKMIKSHIESLRSAIPQTPYYEIMKLSPVDNGELDSLIINMKIDNRRYADIKEAINKKIPTEKRDMRNYIYKVWDRHKKGNSKSTA